MFSMIPWLGYIREGLELALVLLLVLLAYSFWKRF